MEEYEICDTHEPGLGCRVTLDPGDWKSDRTYQKYGVTAIACWDQHHVRKTCYEANKENFVESAVCLWQAGYSEGGIAVGMAGVDADGAVDCSWTKSVMRCNCRHAIMTRIAENLATVGLTCIG